MERSIRLLKRPRGKGRTEKKVDAKKFSGASLTSIGSLREKGSSNKVKYINIPLHSYKYLSSLADQVEFLEDKLSMLQDRVNDLTDDLYAADLEIIDKTASLKKQEMVSAEAVSGLGKASTEVLALKQQLESLMLLKVTAEDHALHLDAALKENMLQIKTVKKEHEEKQQELVFDKNEQWEKIKVSLEAQITDLSRTLLQSDAENAALSRSVQEQSKLLVEISEQKTHVEVDNELLKGRIQLYENDVSSLKYEVNVATKELEIRKEEKNMSRRSTEAANKQHLEDVNKIAELEAECQRLRNLVRKKLPGPAALAQMKKKTGNMSDECIEPQAQKPPIPGKSSKSLLLMEREIKMLKEALVIKDSEVQSSTGINAKIVGRFKKLEVQIGALIQMISSWGSMFEIRAEGCVTQNRSSSYNAASTFEGGSSDKLQATVSVLDHPTYKKTSTCSKPVNANSLEIMDDFLEMEIQANNEICDTEKSAKGLDSNMVHLLFSNLLSKITMVLESQVKSTDIRKALDDTANAMQEIGNSLVWHLLFISAKESHPVEFSDKIEPNPQKTKKMSKRDFAQSISDQSLMAAISRIHHMVLSANRKLLQDHKNELDDLTASTDSFLLNKIILVDFFIDLSHVLVQTTELKFRDMIKAKLHEKEQLVVDLQNQMEASKKELKEKTEDLHNMLQEEKRDHQDSLVRYMNLQEKWQRL